MPDAPTPLDLDAIRARADARRDYADERPESLHVPEDYAALADESAADVPALVEEVKRLRAEVAMTARPAPAWDEDIARCCTGDASQRDGHHKSCRYVHGDLRPDPDDRETLADDAEAKVERQRDRLRARERQVRRLRAEVTRLHALVADLRATASPAWDEEAAVEDMARAVYPSLFADDRQPPRGEARSDAELREGERDVARERMRQALAVALPFLTARPAPAWDEEAARGALVDAHLASVRQVMEDGYPSIFVRSNEDAADAALAVVREHLPVKSSREAVARALAEHRLMGGRCRCGLDPRLDYYRYEQHVTDAVLDLLPGRSEAEVKAEALREFADAHRFPSHWILFRRDDGTGVTVSDMLREVSDRLAAEGGVDRG